MGDRLARAGVSPARSAGPASPIVAYEEAWTRIVAPDIARNSWPHRLTRAGVLTIACADAGWAQELGAHAETLERQLQTAIPDLPLQRLRFMVADRERAPATVPSRSVPPAPARAHHALAAHAVEGMSDEELKKALKRAIAASLALREASDQAGDSGRR